MPTPILRKFQAKGEQIPHSSYFQQLKFFVLLRLISIKTCGTNPLNLNWLKFAAPLLFGNKTAKNLTAPLPKLIISLTRGFGGIPTLERGKPERRYFKGFARRRIPRNFAITRKLT